MTIQRIRKRLIFKSVNPDLVLIGDDRDTNKGITHSYQLLNTGAQSGTSIIDIPHTIGVGDEYLFIAPNYIWLGAGGNTPDYFEPGDTVVIFGTALNDGVYTVASETANSINTVQQTIQAEAPALPTTVVISKRAVVDNTCVRDNRTGLIWKASPSDNNPERLGYHSSGRLPWFDGSLLKMIYATNTDLNIIGTDRMRIVNGAALIKNFQIGSLIKMTGWVNDINNQAGYVILSAAVAGLNLNITFWTGNQNLIFEGPGVPVYIEQIPMSAFNYPAAANKVGFAGWTDWRLPTAAEVMSLMSFATPDSNPDPAYFAVGWTEEDVISSTMASGKSKYIAPYFPNGIIYDDDLTYPGSVLLVRGG